MDKRIVLRAIEKEVRSKILDRAGISVCEYLAYLNYTREIWSRFDKLTSRALEIELNIAKAKWQGRGLNPTLLQAIREFINENFSR